MNNYLRNIARMVVPSAVGAAISWGVGQWGHLSIGIRGLLTPILASAWFALFHWLEGHFKWASYFLGSVPAKFQPPVPTPVAPPAK